MALRGAAIAFAAVVLGISAGCVEASGFQYVSNRSAGAFVRMPEEWEVFSDREMREALGDLETLQWAVSFDANPKPSIARFATLDTKSPHPSGIVQVIQLTEEERQFFTMDALRNVIVPVDTGVEDGTVKDLDEETVAPKGFEGERLRFTFVKEDGSRYRIAQTVLVDADLSTVYLFAVGCEERCFSKNQRVIDELVTSWKVRST